MKELSIKTTLKINKTVHSKDYQCDLNVEQQWVQ